MTPDEQAGQDQPKRGRGRPSNAQKAAMSNAINHPVNTGNNLELESAGMMPEFDDVVDYSHLKFTLVAPQVQVVGEREFRDVAEQEKFMTDRLVIVIGKTKDKNEPPMVPAGLNGDIAWFPRGIKIRVPRGIVGSLLQSQERAFSTVKNNDPNADEGMLTKQSHAPSYPVTVLYDPQPKKGQAWMRRTMAEGC